jgi:DNA-binding HxlR family transcriptional regulator
MILDGKTAYGEFLSSEENIATNILARRLISLEEVGFISKERDPKNGTKYIYSLTEKSLALVPLFIDMMLWSEVYSPIPVPEERKEVAARARSDRQGLIEEIQQSRRAGIFTPF